MKYKEQVIVMKNMEVNANISYVGLMLCGAKTRCPHETKMERSVPQASVSLAKEVVAILSSALEQPDVAAASGEALTRVWALLDDEAQKSGGGGLLKRVLEEIEWTVGQMDIHCELLAHPHVRGAGGSRPLPSRSVVADECREIQRRLAVTAGMLRGVAGGRTGESRAVEWPPANEAARDRYGERRAA